MNITPLTPSQFGSAPSDLKECLAMQRKAYHANPVPTYYERKADLLTLQRFIKDNADEMIEAINTDYTCRSTHETLMAEIGPAIETVDFALKNLKKWMKPQRREVDLRTFVGATNKVIPQPLGIVGAIVPWNFPLNLSMVPLAQILAAGNRAMIKMSENSRTLTRVIQSKLPSYFPRDKVAFFEETGGVGVEFSKLPFDHLLFTGSSTTGRAVMAAAAANLCPVTLELGGKSPAIVCDDYPLQKAAERIMFIKCMNAGQICTNVDNLWLPEDSTEEFVALAKQLVASFYPKLSSPDFTSIIDERSFKRLTNALQTAKTAGAKVIQLLPGDRWNAKTRKIAPHIVLNCPEDHELMTREIFGPILPIREYKRLDEVISYINERPRPLAVYPFSYDEDKIQTILDHVMSGGVSVNDALFHVGQHDLPFGGVGASGMGHYHSYEGFLTFSKLRPVFYQADLSALKLLHPPYGTFATRLLNYLAR